MSTRSNSSHLFSPLRDPESLIRRRNLGKPSSLFNFEEVMNNNHNQEPPPQNGPPPMVRPHGKAPRTMEDLCQPVSDDALRLSLFPYSLTHHAIAWYDRLPRNSIYSFDDMMRKFLSKYFPPFMVTQLRNEITKFEQNLHESLFEAWERYKLSIDWRKIYAKDTGRMLRIDLEYDCSPQPLGYLTVSGYTQETSDATASNYNSGVIPTNRKPQLINHKLYLKLVFQAYMKANDAVMKNMQTQTTSLTNLNLELKNMLGQFIKMNTASSSGTGLLPSNTIPNPREDFKVITTWSGVTLAGPPVSPSSSSSSSSKEVDRGLETITDQLLTESTNNVPPLVVQPSPASTHFSTISSFKMPEETKDMVQPSIENIQPPVAQTQVPIKPVVAPNPKPTIPYP
nr:reverse transcriptase domain-containing protein [Tanacetum cinerariifolium]